MTCRDTANHPHVDSTILKKLSAVRVELQAQQSYANVITEMITFCTLTTDGDSDICKNLKEDLAKTQQCIAEKVPNITLIKHIIKTPIKI